MQPDFQRIIGYNLLILLVIAGILRLLNQGTEGGVSFALIMAGVIALQAFLNSLFAIFTVRSTARQAHWLSFLRVLLVGFGACAGGLALYS